MSTLRERIEALAKEWETQGNSPVRFAYHEQHAADSAEADTFSRCAEALRSALESETREADPCEYAPGETVMNLYDKAREEGRRAATEEAALLIENDTGPAYTWSAASRIRIARAIRSLSTPPPANTENDR